ncbi:unnamed protein product [Pieris brassicae]|uniref:Uncharacterized protein n=1 Tax=Pieris brassicae TaxID=7116 RepID=A0A9P0TZB7_PIEBR|nr:unnamed protein product [Pieris brassicae]
MSQRKSVAATLVASGSSAFAMDKYKRVALSVIAVALRHRITLPPASSLVRRSVETSRATTQRSSGACYKKYMKNDAATMQRSDDATQRRCNAAQRTNGASLICHFRVVPIR